jgi:hypothetical protein
MTFLNGVLLIGAVAGTVPLTIHLLNRNRTRIVRWGAMQLLEADPKQKRRDIELEQIMLLLLRISIPILLALCMARPIASSLKASVHSAPASTVLILDDSASMSASAGDTSSFEKSKANAADFIHSLGRGSEVAVISTTHSRHPLVPPTLDTANAAQKVRALLPSHQAADIPSAVENLAEYLAGMHNPLQRVVLFTDFQSANWSEQKVEQLRDLVQRLSALNHKPVVTFFDTGPFQSENVALESIDFTKLPVASNQTVHFTATIRNFGTQPKANIPVCWKVDGMPVANTPISVAPHQSTQVHIARSFDTVGTHTIEAGIGGDSFLSDNSIYATIEVQSAIRVLIVSGKLGSEPFQGETDFLELALEPKTRASRQSTLFSIKTISTDDLTARHIADARVVVLANTPRLKDSQLEMLERLVHAGGGLAFFPGSRTDLSWSNQALHNNGKGLLPSKLSEPVNSTKDYSTGIRVASGPYTHPALQIFNSDETNLAGIEIQTWYKLNSDPLLPSKEAGSQPQKATKDAAFIFLSLENGDPLFVEHKYGAGHVIESAIPCNAEWSNFPTRPVFVPAMQRLIGHLHAVSNETAKLKAGEPIFAQVPVETVAPAIRSPDGSAHAPVIEKTKDCWTIRFEKTLQPGFYTLERVGSNARSFAVNADRLESDPARLATAEIESLSKKIGADLVRNMDDLIDSIASTQKGRELWRPLLLVLLVFLFAEIALQQRFNPRASAPK